MREGEREGRKVEQGRKRKGKERESSWLPCISHWVSPRVLSSSEDGGNDIMTYIHRGYSTSHSVRLEVSQAARLKLKQELHHYS